MASKLFGKRKTFSELEATKSSNLRQTNVETDPAALLPDLDCTFLISGDSTTTTPAPTWPAEHTTQFTVINATAEQVTCLKQQMASSTISTGAPLSYPAWNMVAICKNRYLVKFWPAAPATTTDPWDNTKYAHKARDILQSLGLHYTEETVLFVNLAGIADYLALAQINTLLWNNATILAEYFDNLGNLILQVAADEVHNVRHILTTAPRTGLRCFTCQEPTCTTADPGNASAVSCKYPVANCGFCYPGCLFKCRKGECEPVVKCCNKHGHGKNQQQEQHVNDDDDDDDDNNGHACNKCGKKKKQCRKKKHQCNQCDDDDDDDDEVYELIPRRK